MICPSIKDYKTAVQMTGHVRNISTREYHIFINSRSYDLPIHKEEVEKSIVDKFRALKGGTSTTGVSNSIMLGSGAASGVSYEFMINNIHHLNIPALTTSANGTGILLQYGGAKSDWVEASGGTYNLVEKIDTIIYTIQGQVPAKIIFTTTLTNPPICQLDSPGWCQ